MPQWMATLLFFQNVIKAVDWCFSTQDHWFSICLSCTWNMSVRDQPQWTLLFKHRWHQTRFCWAPFWSTWCQVHGTQECATWQLFRLFRHANQPVGHCLHANFPFMTSHPHCSEEGEKAWSWQSFFDWQGIWFWDVGSSFFIFVKHDSNHPSSLLSSIEWLRLMCLNFQPNTWSLRALIFPMTWLTLL